MIPRQSWPLYRRLHRLNATPDWTTEPVWSVDPGTDVELIERACARDPTFKALVDADMDVLATAYADGSGRYDNSRADAALACRLVQIFGGDCQRTLECMLMGGLELRRPKWDNGTYLEDHTIPSALREVMKTNPRGAADVFGKSPFTLPAPVVGPQPALRTSGGVELVSADEIQPAAHRMAVARVPGTREADVACWPTQRRQINSSV